MIGAESAEPDSGNLSVGVKDPFRDKSGIDLIGRLGERTVQERSYQILDLLQ